MQSLETQKLFKSSEVEQKRQLIKLLIQNLRIAGENMLPTTLTLCRTSWFFKDCFIVCCFATELFSTQRVRMLKIHLKKVLAIWFGRNQIATSRTHSQTEISHLTSA